eukprot:2757297-Lingulodinium_polyedra.AAC.1
MAGAWSIWATRVSWQPSCTALRFWPAKAGLARPTPSTRAWRTRWGQFWGQLSSVDPTFCQP